MPELATPLILLIFAGENGGKTSLFAALSAPGVHFRGRVIGFPRFPRGPAKIQRSKRCRSTETKWSFKTRRCWSCLATGKSVHFSYTIVFSISGWERETRASQPIPWDVTSSPFPEEYWLHTGEPGEVRRRRKETHLPCSPFPISPVFSGTYCH